MPKSQSIDLGPAAYYPNSVTLPFKESSKPSKDKDEPCKAYKQMKKHWELPLALRGGTLEMREKREKWLPREPKETLDAYECRLKRTVCFEAFNRTVSTLAGLPFMRSITVEGIPEPLAYLKTDCDGMGRDLTSFSHALLKETLELGLTHVYVDMPYFEGDLSIADQETFKIRPHFIHISPERIISWSTKRIGGVTILDSISIEEEFEEYTEDGEEVEIEQIRKVFADRIEIRRENDKGEWVLYSVLPNRLGKIPLVTLYGNYTGILQGLPPLEGLAWLNLKHYQKQSDVDNIEHVACVPILFAAGFKEGELEGAEIGINRVLVCEDTAASLKFVEHSGQATGGSRESLKALEEQMAAMGADLIVRKSVDRQTATARSIDQSESISMLQIMINNLESTLEQAIKIAGEWVNVDVGDELQIDIGDYLDTPNGPNFLDFLAQHIINNNGMTLEEVQHELKRRGVLSDVFQLGKKQVVEKINVQVKNEQGDLIDTKQTDQNLL